MPELKNDPTLKDFQNYVKELEIERGFTEEDVIHKCLMLGEEVGELFKSIRKSHDKLKIDSNSKLGEIGDEITDVFIFLCSIANRCNVDIEDSFRFKEEINKKRKWS